MHQDQFKTRIALVSVYRFLISVFAFLLLASLNQAATGATAEKRSPAAAITEFNKWHFHELNPDHEPNN